MQYPVLFLAVLPAVAISVWVLLALRKARKWPTVALDFVAACLCSRKYHIPFRLVAQRCMADWRNRLWDVFMQLLVPGGLCLVTAMVIGAYADSPNLLKGLAIMLGITTLAGRMFIVSILVNAISLNGIPFRKDVVSERAASMFSALAKSPAL